jgi:hypothetical protein
VKLDVGAFKHHLHEPLQLWMSEKMMLSGGLKL